MVAKNSKLNRLVKSDTTAIFTFGRTRSGKSTLLLALYECLFNTPNYFVELGNDEGAKAILRWSKRFRTQNMLPEINSLTAFYEVSFGCGISDEEEEDNRVVLTFLDMPGELLQKVDPSQQENAQFSDGKLDAKIVQYIECKKLPIILLCILDHNNLDEDIRLLHVFLNYLKRFDREFAGILTVITKWDTFDVTGDAGNTRAAEVVKNTPAFKAIRDFVKRGSITSSGKVKVKALPFSIGEVERNANGDYTQKVINANLDYAKPIIETIFNIAAEESYSASILDKIPLDEFEKTLEQILKLLGH